MRAIIAVFKREVGLYFRSPVAYAIAFALTLFLSLIFNSYLVQANQRFPAEPSFIPSLLTFLMFLIAPLLTMRLLAEESREGTMEVLMTLPMGEGSFIIGKFLAAWFYYTVLLAITLIYQYVLAVTMIWSAVTEDQVVAAFLGAATVLMLYLADFAAVWVSGQSVGSTGAADFVRELGLQSHYDATMLQGILRLEDVLYFVLMIIGALFITTRIVETRRWRA